MDYYINPSSFTSVFTVPSQVVDRHLKFAKAEHIKVLLFVLKNMAEEIAESDIAKATGLNEYDVGEALLYWADANILLPKKETAVSKENEPKTVEKKLKPSRNDIAKRGLEDPKIQFMLREAQIKLGRALKTNESKTLLWLYDDEGLDVSLILLILQYAVQNDKANIRFIEKVAVDWVNKGIDNMTDADEELRKMAINDRAWKMVATAFGLGNLKPSKKQQEKASLWVNEWGMTSEMLVAAYDACVDSISEFSFNYVTTIIEKWHKEGYETPDEIEDKRPKKQEDYEQDELEMFKKMIKSKG